MDAETRQAFEGVLTRLSQAEEKISILAGEIMKSRREINPTFAYLNDLGAHNAD